MGAALYNRPAAHDEDSVAVHDRLEPVRHEDDGPHALQGPERFDQMPLVLGIQRASRLVEVQERGLREQRAGDGDALALAAGQVLAAVAQMGFVALRQILDEPGRARHRGGLGDFLLGGLGTAIRNILGNADRQHDVLLTDQRHVRPQVRDANAPEIESVKPQRAFGRVVEAQHQVEQRALARAARPDEVHHLAWPDLGRNVLQHPLPLAVAEADPVEDERARLQLQGRGVRGFCDSDRRVYDVEDAPGRRDVELDLRDELGEPLQRLPELARVIHEDEKRADGHAACDRREELVLVHEVAAIAEDDRAGDGQNAVAGERIKLLQPVQAQKRTDAALDPALEAAELIRLAPERLREAHGRDRLLDIAGQVRIDLLGVKRALMNAQPKAPVAPDHQRGYDERRHREVYAER